MSSPLLSFERVGYRYPGAREAALSDVSIELGPGEFCLLAGLSGHGKSTLLRAACGLVPHFHGGHFAGRVTLAGLDTREHGPADLGAIAGVLFQDPETQLVMSTVRAELALALESRGHGATSSTPSRVTSSSACCDASTRSGRRRSCSRSIASSGASPPPTA
jgi:energy-coupling factor transport system ATP-binding protein